jgi:hypothetical protein
MIKLKKSLLRKKQELLLNKRMDFVEIRGCKS